MSALSSEEVVDDGACFACGEHNAAGLKLRFRRTADGTAQAGVTLDAALQGYRGVAHGGIVMLLLDEAMAHAAGAAGEKAMTAAVSVRFRAPVPLGAPLDLRGRVVSTKGRLVKLEASLLDAAGSLLASGEGSFVSLGALSPAERERFALSDPETAPASNLVPSGEV